MCRHNPRTNPSFQRQINCDTKFVEGRCGLGGQRVGRGREGRRGQRWPGPGGSGREELSVITSQSGQFRWHDNSLLSPNRIPAGASQVSDISWVTRVNKLMSTATGCVTLGAALLWLWSVRASYKQSSQIWPRPALMNYAVGGTGWEGRGCQVWRLKE